MIIHQPRYNREGGIGPRYSRRELTRWMARYLWNTKERQEYYQYARVTRFLLRNEGKYPINMVAAKRTILK